MDNNKTAGVRRAVTAADVTATTITIPTDGKQLKGAQVSLRTAAGVVIAWDGAVVISTESLVLDNTGAVDFADTNVFDIVFW